MRPVLILSLEAVWAGGGCCDSSQWLNRHHQLLPLVYDLICNILLQLPFIQCNLYTKQHDNILT